MDSETAKTLYTRKIDQYAALIGFFRSRAGLRRLLEKRVPLGPSLCILDAGCGFGMATFALIDALRARGLDYERVDAFDLTPAMLERFGREIERRDLPRLQLMQADATAPDALPPGWLNYDLVISTSMFEYLPRDEVPHVLTELRRRLAPGGQLLLMITRKTPETRVLIEWAWQGERYGRRELRAALEAAGFRSLTFLRFPFPYLWLSRANHVVLASV